MKTSYLTAGMGMGNLLRLLHKNKITFRPKYIGRTLFLLQSAFWTSVFATIEQLTLKKRIERTPVPENPIFIIGHWRTGSTYLHQLMNLDPANAAPTLFQVAVPQCSLVSYPFHRPIMKAAIGKHRPMDKVRLGMDEPQEDEYAIYRLTDFSPLERLVFPASRHYFLLGEKTFIPSGQALEPWKKQIISFYQKLNYITGKTIVSKNPFNSMRIQLLAEMFPQSRFIYIVRNPVDVVPSSIHMWDIVQQQNALKNHEHRPEVGEIVSFFREMIRKIDDDLTTIPDTRKVIIRYEDLELDALTCLKNIYVALSLPFTQQFENAVKAFVDETKSFEKNTFNLTDEDRSFICHEMDEYMKAYCYN